MADRSRLQQLKHLPGRPSARMATPHEQYDADIRRRAARILEEEGNAPASRPVPQLTLTLLPRPQSHGNLNNKNAPALNRPSSAVQPGRPFDARERDLRRVQSAMVLKREQRRAAAVEETASAAKRPGSAGVKREFNAVTAAKMQADRVRAAAYKPSEVQSTVPPEYRKSNALPIFTGHLLAPADRDRGFKIHDEGLSRLHQLATAADQPRTPKMDAAGGSAAQLRLSGRPASADARSWRNPPAIPPSGSGIRIAADAFDRSPVTSARAEPTSHGPVLSSRDAAAASAEDTRSASPVSTLTPPRSPKLAPQQPATKPPPPPSPPQQASLRTIAATLTCTLARPLAAPFTRESA